MNDHVSDPDPLTEEVRRMSDDDLRQAAAAIRGTSKRGRRRRLSEVEALILAAVMAEQARRVRSVA